MYWLLRYLNMWLSYVLGYGSGVVAFELIKKDFPSDWPIYWIMTFPDYGKSVFYGTELQVQELFLKTSKREGAGLLRRADPRIKEDQELVQEEIANVALDRRAGIKNLPNLPHENGF